MNSVCVFCGSRHGLRPEYRQAARDFGRLLGERDLALVYGGGEVGLMGEIADAALAAGGQVIGVITEALLAREVAHLGLTELITVETMHERKARMADLADGFVALPGGFGTLDELCEIITWGQLGIHRRPVGLLDVAEFFVPMIGAFDHAVREGFIEPIHRERLLTSNSPQALLDQMSAFAAGQAVTAAASDEDLLPEDR